MARSKTGKHPSNTKIEREQRKAKEQMRVERGRGQRFAVERPHEVVAPGPTEEEREDAYWETVAAWSGDPDFRERYPVVMERHARALRLAAEELGLGVVEREGVPYIERGPVPNVIAYHAAAMVFPEGWDMVLNPYPDDADVDFGYGDDEPDRDEENDRRAQEVWEKIEPLC